MNVERGDQGDGAMEQADTDAPVAKLDEPENPEAPEHQTWGSRAPGFIQRSRALHLSWQVGVFIVGLAIVTGGVILLPLPGPGWLVIFAGMAVWATEFVWAQIVLRWTKRKVTEAAQRALDPKVRRRNAVLTAAGLVICGVLLGVYLYKFGLEMPWNV